MKWTKITIETTTQATDMLSYALGEYGVEGIEVEDKIPLSEADKKAMFIDILPELPPDDGVAYVSCYIDDNKDVKMLCTYIEEQLQELAGYTDIGSGHITIDETEDKDWINNWKEFFHPFRLEENIVIQPIWTDSAEVKDEDIVVYIDPGTAFGTGSHETTRLCIAGLKKYISKIDITEVLDLGCGSGILSIIAMKLGADKVYGVDIDELAVKASKENLERNKIAADRYEMVRGNVLEDKDFAAALAGIGPFDVVVANILADVIIPLSAIVRPYLKENGVFITSGIIEEKEEDVREALLRNGFEIVEVTHMGEWVAMTAKNKEEISQ